MSKRILKSFAAVGLAAVVIFSVTACSAPTSPEEPAMVRQSEGTGSGGYTEEYVQQSDDSVVRCLFWAKGTNSAAMSCDFANAEGGPTEGGSAE